MNIPILPAIALILIICIVVVLYRNDNKENYACTQSLCSERSAGNSVQLQCQTSQPFGDQSCCNPDNPDGLVATCDESGQYCSCCPPGYWIDKTRYENAANTCLADGLWFSFYSNDGQGGNWQCGQYCMPPTFLTMDQVNALPVDANGDGTTQGVFPPGNYSQVGSTQFYLHCSLGSAPINAANSTVTYGSDTWNILSFMDGVYNEDVLILYRLIRPNKTTYKRLTSPIINTMPTNFR
jgi:hypothetical protein